MCATCDEYDEQIVRLDGHLDRVHDTPGAFCVVRRTELAELREFLVEKKNEGISEAVADNGW